MKQRRIRIPFYRSLSFRALIEHAVADAFASLGAETDSRSEPPREQSRRPKAKPKHGWVTWARRRPGDSLA